MEALRQDDPRRFGPYTVLGRFRETAAAVQYLAHGSAPEDLVVITAARPELAALPAFRRRFQAESRTADRLSGGWVEARLDAPDDGPEDDGRLWTASAYVPALTLAEAVDIAGPLPERAVRILGAGIAETLSRVHATGAVLQGLAPRTVLLAEDGPRLTAFGPLGAAADAEARPGGQLSVRLGYLTPEQVAGQEAGPASDLFVLGLLLAYAATGSTPLADGPAAEAADRIAHTDPRLDAVPDELRDLVARCLAKDPADRPTAGAVAAELALEGAAGLAKGGWLPARLTAAVAEQGDRVRNLEAAPPTAPETVQDAAVVQDAVPVTAEDSARSTPPPAPLPAHPAPARPRHPDRAARGHRSHGPAARPGDHPALPAARTARAAGGHPRRRPHDPARTARPRPRGALPLRHSPGRREARCRRPPDPADRGRRRSRRAPRRGRRGARARVR
ncbi:protein kinase [Streptomyces sp. LN549]|uniref:protein kinase domain-containing protein n=1 Tax=Streptomyces sp. LN549 TaxID=3112979 RepID=UPI003721E2AC